MNAGIISAFLLVVFVLALLATLLMALVRVSHANRRLRMERDALQQEKEVIFGFVHDVGEVFAHSEEIDLDRMLQRVLFYALRTTRAGAGVIYLMEPGETTLRARTVSGIFPPLAGTLDPGFTKAVSKSQHLEHMIRNQHVRKGEGLIGEVADFGKAILIEDAALDSRIPRYEEEFLHIHSIVLVPMRFLQKVLGVVAVTNRVDRRPFSETDMSLLQALADQASVSVHYAGMRESLDEKKQIDYDLNVARQIQTALLPKSIPHIEGVEMGAFAHPAREIGGDYYDFIRVDEDHLGIAIADVSGKGIVGAIMMSICRSTFRAQAPGCTNPADVLIAVDRVMADDIAEDMFVSMLYMVLNIRTRELTVARAGHERPALSQAGKRGFTIVDSPGIAMGIADMDAFEASIKPVTVPLQAHDVVVAYTDGVTEAMNVRGEEWGIDNFLEAVSIAAPEGANSVLNNVQQRLLRFVGDMGQYDDMTLLALRVLE